MFIAVAQKKTNSVPQSVQGLRHSLAAIADVKAQLLQSSLMELRGTLLLGQCLAACILYDERFRKRRVLLQYAHELEHGQVLMSHETSHPVVPALARVIGLLSTAERRIVHAPHWRRVQRRRALHWAVKRWVGRT